ncbi:hypothetical protein HYFRA_00006959 [Hymenoscyphus fraxineus]|uniref:Uncharacterized protein n=1 Tax=Hymenoscyphus fraxineus TaxID=746836 RepID=A0A9N9KP03_9HELO|nr:hypothetical protein HYFRA_00006959 [Hymenoscyphus fraxineus]
MYPAIVKKFLSIIGRRITIHMTKLGYPQRFFYSAYMIYAKFQSCEKNLVSQWGVDGLKAAKMFANTKIGLDVMKNLGGVDGLKAAKVFANTKIGLDVMKNLGNGSEKQGNSATDFKFSEKFSRPKMDRLQRTVFKE